MLGKGLATPLSPSMQQEGSGVSDILHGNFNEGAGKIWEAEKPHVIQGSRLEKAMQVINPSFHGSVTSDEAKASGRAIINVASAPAVDAAQFIDKDKHPAEKAVAEVAQNLTTPANLAILHGTGGLGLIDSAASRGLATKLLSGGFSALAIANAYKNLKGFKEAFDKGDSTEAILSNHTRCDFWRTRCNSGTRCSRCGDTASTSKLLARVGNRYRIFGGE